MAGWQTSSLCGIEHKNFADREGSKWRHCKHSELHADSCHAKIQPVSAFQAVVTRVAEIGRLLCGKRGIPCRNVHNPSSFRMQAMSWLGTSEILAKRDGDPEARNQ